ncbi:Sensor protein SrrB [compost metagenome]
MYLGVRDFGIGIIPELQQTVFEKFYRVEETAIHFQGLGIGLYISAEIINRHAGQIGVKSKLGEGSEFYFTIPINVINEADKTKEPYE